MPHNLYCTHHFVKNNFHISKKALFYISYSTIFLFLKIFLDKLWRLYYIGTMKNEMETENKKEPAVSNVNNYIIREQFIEYKNKVTVKSIKFQNARDAVEWYADLTNSDREKFIVTYLDAQHKVICFSIELIGATDSSAVYPGIIMRNALINSATAIICMHNHPAGDPRPSDNDRQVTRLLVRAGKVLGIRMLDHVIVGDNSTYHSFAEQGLIQQYEGQSI